MARLLCKTEERFGDLLFEMIDPFSFSGDGEDPPVAELRLDGVKRTVVSKWRNLQQSKIR